MSPLSIIQPESNTAKPSNKKDENLVVDLRGYGDMTVSNVTIVIIVVENQVLLGKALFYQHIICL